MELKTKSKRPGMNCSIDVFYEKVKGFSAYLNDRNVYKAVLVKTGSFVVDENGEYRVVTAPAGILINEKADFKVVSENNITTSTIYFKPTFIREEFTFEAINSRKYDKFYTTINEGENRFKAIEGDVKFEDCFPESVYQEYLYLTEFYSRGRDVVYYSLTAQEYDSMNRLAESVRYDLYEQPDNFWILRVRYFLLSMLFAATGFLHQLETIRTVQRSACSPCGKLFLESPGRRDNFRQRPQTLLGKQEYVERCVQQGILHVMHGVS